MIPKIRGYVGISIITVLTTLKRFAIGVALLLIGWLTYTVFFGNLINGTKTEQIVSFFAIWIIAAYVFIPRVHRVLTRLYIPNYFIGRVRTADGLLSDPVNLAFIGSEKQLHKAMQKAGWVLADDLSIRSGIKMVLMTLLRRSYPNAPVSSAFLFNERQTFTYQQQVRNRPSARHHVRFWKTPKGWLLPGGYKVDWLASGTYDRSVGLSYFTFQITHKIDYDTDIERDYIVDTIQTKTTPKQVKVIDNYFSAYHHRNGGGDVIMTDGALPIIEL